MLGGVAGVAAGGSLVSIRWVISGYGRWVGRTFSDSLQLALAQYFWPL